MPDYKSMFELCIQRRRKKIEGGFTSDDVRMQKRQKTMVKIANNHLNRSRQEEKMDCRSKSVCAEGENRKE